MLLAAAVPSIDGGLLSMPAPASARPGLAAGIAAAAAQAMRCVDNDAVARRAGARKISPANGLAARGRAIAADLSRCARAAAPPASPTRPPSRHHQSAVSFAGTAPAFGRSQKAHAHVASGFPARRKSSTPGSEGLPCAAAPGGLVIMIHRADHLAVTSPPRKRRFGGLAVLPVHPFASQPAGSAVPSSPGAKEAGQPLKLAPGLVLHEDNGRFTPLAEAIHRGETASTGSTPIDRSHSASRRPQTMRTGMPSSV